MDGSLRSAHGNAYFTGIGRNKRVVFFDTLLSRIEPEEIEAVLAHELGHFRCITSASVGRLDRADFLRIGAACLAGAPAAILRRAGVPVRPPPWHCCCSC